MKRTQLLAAVLGFTLAHTVSAVPVHLDIPWEKSWPVVTPATAAKFGFDLKNSGKSQAKVKFVARLTSPSGKEEEVEKVVTVDPGKTKRVDWPLTGREKGVWHLAYEATQEADLAANLKGEVSFGFMDPAGPNDTKPAFKFGIVSHTERSHLTPADRDQELEAAAFIGCKVMRMGSEWGYIQPSAGQWRWDVMDHLVEKSASLGMEIQVLLAYGTQWAAAPEYRNSKDWLDWSRHTPNLDAWREFVSTYATRYKGRIHLWETWNEPDLEGFYRGTTAEYIDMLKVSLEELHKVDPANIVMTGGFATLSNHPSRKKNPNLQEEVMKTMGTKVDIHAVHEHGPFDRFAQIVDGPYATMRAALPKPVPPIFFNETAEHSAHGTEKEQALVLVKKAVFARARGGVGYLWYDLRNDGTDEGEPEHNFGLVTEAMEPKPAYVAFNTVAKEVVPRPYLKQVDAGENRWFFLHGDDKEKLLVFWNEDASTQNEQILLRLPGATEASLMDINGNVTPLPISSDLVVVSSSKEPHLLFAKGASDVESAGRLAGPQRAFFGGPGEEVSVSCEFSNPTAKPVTIKTKWALPMAMQLVTPAPESITVPANSKGTSTVVARLPEGDGYLLGRSGKLKVSYEFAGMPYNGSLLIPVHYGTIAVPAGPANRPPDVVLDTQDQITSFIEADPHMTPYRWKGPKDLSANLWFQADASDLIVRVAVTDNKHFQPGPAPDMWMGDSVQCIIAMPGQKGSWEIGFAEDNAGKPLAAVWATPSGFTNISDKIRVSVEKQGENRIYTARIPRKDLGLTDQMLREGFRFNLAVNDNDGQVRAHALQIAPGIVATKTTDSAPYLVFKQEPAKAP